MTTPDKYSMTVDELVATANVPFDEQVEEQKSGERPQPDEHAGHLPGGVRPYGA